MAELPPNGEGGIVPESKGRKSVEQNKARAAQRAEGATAGKPKPSPRWWAPVMVALMVLGLVLVVVTYLSKGTLPVADWGNANLVVGFAVMMIGFLMTTKWR